MDFVAVLDQAIALLRQRGRLTYRTLQLQLQLDDAHLEALKDELIEGQRLAADEAGRVLVWTGDPATPGSPASPSSLHAPPPAASSPLEAERRQLTVLFCDLVDSTALSSQLDPEDLREVVRAYQATCAKMIARFEGHIAQYLGDGLLVYFGYPLAHEDDAQRAVRAGLGMVEALGQLNTHLAQARGVQLAVRLGIHTGLVVVGDVGGGTRQEQLALGETPNLAARLQGLAAPNTLVISAATVPLLGGFFACQPLGTHLVKGVAQPLEVYQVVYERMARSRLEAAGSMGLTPLVGREQEVGLLLERWTQVKDGLGQVVLLSGEAGIGKSRLVQVLQEQVASEPQAWLTPCQCSPYHQHTAWYPLIELLERVALRFEREEAPAQKLRKLEGFLVQYGLPLAEAVPLLAAVLSLPLPADAAPLAGSPEQQKQRTLQTFLTILGRIAAQQPVLFVMEDLHWADPTTLELLSLLVDQGPTARILALWTFRPDFTPPWTGRAHLTQMTLPRLPRHQAMELTGRVAHGKALPAEVVAQVVAKTDGVPLFVEELTKMVLESGLLQERDDRYDLTSPLPPLAIPATLHDSLMARLDRLAAVKGLAQLGATLGREFAYELLQAVSPWDEGTVQRGLSQLVEAEFLYQQGLPPQATYHFKHALIQAAAYQSLLKSTRQQYHQHIAQVLEARFPDLCATQPEVLAHHYTEAGVLAQAIPYWQQAGARAFARAALHHLPERQETCEQAIDLRLEMRNVLIALGDFGRMFELLREAEALAKTLEDQRRLGWVSAYLSPYFSNTGDQEHALETGQRALAIATASGDFALEIMATFFVGLSYLALGQYQQEAQYHRRNVEALQDPWRYERFGEAGLPFVFCRAYLDWGLAELGAFGEGLVRGEEAIQVAETVEQPFTLSHAYLGVGLIHLRKGDLQQAIAVLEKSLQVCQTGDIALLLPWVTSSLGYAYALSGRLSEALPLLEQAVEQNAAMNLMNHHALWMIYLGEAYLLAGRLEDTHQLAAQALTLASDLKQQGYAAHALRLLGEIAASGDPLEVAQAESYYCQAVTLAEALAMRPLQAHCHRGLGTLYAATGQREQSRTELSTAMEMYRAMDMTFWLPQTEATLAQVEGR